MSDEGKKVYVLIGYPAHDNECYGDPGNIPVTKILAVSDSMEKAEKVLDNYQRTPGDYCWGDRNYIIELEETYGVEIEEFEINNFELLE